MASWKNGQRCRRLRDDATCSTGMIIKMKAFTYIIKYDDQTEEELLFEDTSTIPIENEMSSEQEQGANPSENLSTWDEPPEISPQGFCARCSFPSSFRCSICQVAFYCSRRCQRLVWAAHQEYCVAPKTRWSWTQESSSTNIKTCDEDSLESSNLCGDVVDVGTELIDMSDGSQRNDNNTLEWPDNLMDGWSNIETGHENTPSSNSPGTSYIVPVISTNPFDNDDPYCPPCDSSYAAALVDSSPNNVDMGTVDHLMVIVDGVSRDRVIKALKEASGNPDAAYEALLTGNNVFSECNNDSVD